MMRCYSCRRRLHHMPFKCHRCYKWHCSNCRLPENHRCLEVKYQQKSQFIHHEQNRNRFYLTPWLVFGIIILGAWMLNNTALQIPASKITFHAPFDIKKTLFDDKYIGEIKNYFNSGSENTAHFRDENSIEMKIFDGTNYIRKEAGVPYLSGTEYLHSVAKAHSEDMLEENYFEHSNNFQLAENIAEVPIHYDVVGCGITLTDDQIAECLVKGWKNSPGHYRNMINLDYTKLGVGVACDYFECKATQNFD